MAVFFFKAQVAEMSALNVALNEKAMFVGKVRTITRPVTLVLLILKAV